jgi:hypothetical protein
MTKSIRVFNVTRRCFMKQKQAARAVENCACAWLEYGVSLRDLTLAEAIAARNRQASLRDPLPFAELPGLLYRAAPGKEAGVVAERAMSLAANRFALQV